MSRGVRIAIVGGAIVFGAFLILILAAVGLTIRDHFVYVYPTPENQSAFFRSYDPDPALKPFLDPKGLPTSGSWSGGEAGKGAVKLQRGIDKLVAMRADNGTLVLAVLRKDMMLRLRATGAEITEAANPDDGGFRVAYADANATGTVSVKFENVNPAEVGGCPNWRVLPIREAPPCASIWGARLRVVIDESYHPGAPRNG